MPVPKRIALVSLELLDSGAQCHGAGAAEYLLDDFEDTYRAYACDTASEFGIDACDLIPEFITLSWQPKSDEKTVSDSFRGNFEPLELYGDSCGMSCDAVVLACEVNDGIRIETFRNVFASAQYVFTHGCRVYVIVITQKHDAAPAQLVFDTLRNECEVAGFIWMGGVLLGGGLLIPRFINAPRMGFVRHHISEAIDALIMAVKSGKKVQGLQARLGMPRFVYHSLSSRELSS